MNSALILSLSFLLGMATALQPIIRGYGCVPELNSAMEYSALDGLRTFDILCNTSYDSGQFISAVYVTNFTNCMHAYLDWDGGIPCISVQYHHEMKSYEGGKYLCYLLWDMNPVNSTSSRLTVRNYVQRLHWYI